MDMKVYVVFHDNCWEGMEGSWESYTEIDSIWSDPDSAKERVKSLANDYIEEQWYRYGYIPGEDYVEKRKKDNTEITFKIDDYYRTYFFIKEYKLRAGWTEDNKDLPAYFTTAKLEGDDESTL